MTIEEVVAAIVQRVAELPDRTSPEDWPEAMLVTADELSFIIMSEFARAIQDGMPAEEIQQ